MEQGVSEWREWTVHQTLTSWVIFIYPVNQLPISHLTISVTLRGLSNPAGIVSDSWVRFTNVLGEKNCLQSLYVRSEKRELILPTLVLRNVWTFGRGEFEEGREFSGVWLCSRSTSSDATKKKIRTQVVHAHPHNIWSPSGVWSDDIYSAILKSVV